MLFCFCPSPNKLQYVFVQNIIDFKMFGLHQRSPMNVRVKISTGLIISFLRYLDELWSDRRERKGKLALYSNPRWCQCVQRAVCHICSVYCFFVYVVKIFLLYSFMTAKHFFIYELSKRCCQSMIWETRLQNLPSRYTCMPCITNLVPSPVRNVLKDGESREAYWWDLRLTWCPLVWLILTSFDLTWFDWSPCSYFLVFRHLCGFRRWWIWLVVPDAPAVLDLFWSLVYPDGCACLQ